MLPSKFRQNWVSNSLDIAGIEFAVVVGGGVKSFLCQTQLRLCRLSCGWVGVLTTIYDIINFGRGGRIVIVQPNQEGMSFMYPCSFCIHLSIGLTTFPK